jgi:uncharacterized protein YukE
MTGRTRTHHEPATTHQTTHHTTTHEPHTEGTSPHRTSGGGNGLGVHVDAIETMAGRLESTRGRIEGVGSTVRSVNVGPQSMGVIGSGFTGAAEAHVRTAEEHLRRTTDAVEQAQRGTKGTAQAYRDTDAASAASLAAIDSDATPPTPKAPAGGTTPAGTTATATPPSAPPASHAGSSSPPGGGGPPPPSSPPPGGGGPPKNTLGHTATTDELAPQYPRHVIDTSPTPTDQQIKDIAAAKGYDPDQHLPKTQTPTASMSHDDRVEVADVRNGIQVAPGEVMTKVVKPELADALLRNQTSWTDADTGVTRNINPDELGGSVARGSDTAKYGYPQDFREKLGLDDGGAGWSPVKSGATEAYQLRFPAADDTSAFDPSFGSTNHADAVDMQTIGGSSKLRAWDPPFLGTAYTDGGHTGFGLPEWELARDNYHDRIEMWQIGADGREHLVGVNLPGRGWFDLRP